MTYITECSICRDWRNPKPEDPKEPYNPNFYTPTQGQRREYYLSGKKFSHGLCPPGTILTLRKIDLPESELQKMIEEVFTEIPIQEETGKERK